MRLLLDSNVYIHWGRRRQSPARILEARLQRVELVTCGVVRAEILRGAMPLKARTELTKLFRAMIEVHIDEQIWEKTIALAWVLDRQGKVLPLTDVIIAACALREDAAVVTRDEHFNFFPGLTVYPDLP